MGGGLRKSKSSAVDSSSLARPISSEAPQPPVPNVLMEALANPIKRKQYLAMLPWWFKLGVVLWLASGLLMATVFKDVVVQLGTHCPSNEHGRAAVLVREGKCFYPAEVMQNEEAYEGGFDFERP